jgi:hypothetical protein
LSLLELEHINYHLLHQTGIALENKYMLLQQMPQGRTVRLPVRIGMPSLAPGGPPVITKLLLAIRLG